MGKPFKIAGLALIGFIVVIQFIQPERNIYEGSPEHDMLSTLSVPILVAELLQNSCYDCHSANTRYPWYSKISPVSWYLNLHIEQGKEALNFSEFAQLKKRKKIGALSSICEVLELGSMPLPGFLIIHRNAVMDEEEIASICDWSESEALIIMQSDAKP
jgi:Haem-binding domain